MSGEESNGPATLPAFDEADEYDVVESTNQFLAPIGVTHGYSFTVQLDDDHELLDHSVTQMDDIQDDTDQDHIMSDIPHVIVDDWNTPWADSDVEQQVARFGDGDAYGEWTDGEYQQYNAQRFNTYSDVTRGSKGIARNAEKVRVGLHPRHHDLETENRNEYTWPPRHTDGETVTGTCIEVHTSFRDPRESFEQAKRLIIAGFADDEVRQERVRELLADDDLVDWDTFYVRTQETYHRHTRETKKSVIDTLKQASSLAAQGDASGRERGTVHRGEYTMYRFSTDTIEALGFDPEVEYEVEVDDKVETRTFVIPEVDTKCYLHDHFDAADASDEESVYSQPKTECKLFGAAVPLPAFEAVHDRLSEILNSFLCWAGVTEDDLVADARYEPASQRRQTVTAPTGYFYSLLKYYSSDALRNNIIHTITKPCKNLHDILYCIRQAPLGLTYKELEEQTGYDSETCRKYVAKLDNAFGIVERTQQIDGTRASIKDAAQEIVTTAFDTAVSSAERAKSVAQRAKERVSNRLQSAFDDKKEEVHEKERERTDDDVSDEARELAEQMDTDPQYAQRLLDHRANVPDDITNAGFTTGADTAPADD